MPVAAELTDIHCAHPRQVLEVFQAEKSDFVHHGGCKQVISMVVMDDVWEAKHVCP
jgi:hypothetical protein